MATCGFSSGWFCRECFLAPCYWDAKQPAVSSSQQLPAAAAQGKATCEAPQKCLLRRLCSRVLLAGTHPRNGSPQLPWVTAVIFKLWCPLMDDFPQHPRGRSSSTHHCYSILATFPPSTGPQPGPFQQGLGLTLGSPAAGGALFPGHSISALGVVATPYHVNSQTCMKCLTS